MQDLHFYLIIIVGTKIHMWKDPINFLWEKPAKAINYLCNVNLFKTSQVWSTDQPPEYNNNNNNLFKYFDSNSKHFYTSSKTALAGEWRLYLAAERAEQQMTESQEVLTIMEAVTPAGPQHPEKTSPEDHLTDHTRKLI